MAHAPSPSPTIDPDFRGHFIFWIIGGTLLAGVILAFIFLKTQAWLRRACTNQSQDHTRAPVHHAHRGVTGLEKLVLPEEYEEEGGKAQVPACSDAAWEDGSGGGGGDDDGDAGIGPGFGRDEDGGGMGAEEAGNCLDRDGQQAYLSRWDQWERKKAPDQYADVDSIL